MDRIEIKDILKFNLGNYYYTLLINRENLENIGIRKGTIFQNIEKFYRFNKPTTQEMIDFLKNNINDISQIEITDKEGWKDAHGNTTNEDQKFGIRIIF